MRSSLKVENSCPNTRALDLTVIIRITNSFGNKWEKSWYKTYLSVLPSNCKKGCKKWSIQICTFLGDEHLTNHNRLNTIRETYSNQSLLQMQLLQIITFNIHLFWLYWMNFYSEICSVVDFLSLTIKWSLVLKTLYIKHQNM